MSHYDYGDVPQRMSSAELVKLFRDRRKASMEKETESLLTSVGTPPWEAAERGIAAGGCTTPYIGDVPPFTPYAPAYPGQSLPGTTTTLNPGKKNEAMDVWMIWVRDGTDPLGVLWLEEAWDDDSVSGNRDGWDEAVSNAYEKWGGNNVRVVKTDVNFDKVLAAFEPATV